MKNWSFFIKIGFLSGFALLLMAANCTAAKSVDKTAPAPAVTPAAGQSGLPGQTSPSRSADTPAGIPREVGQGAAPNQVQVDSLKAASAAERAKSKGRKPKKGD